MSRGHCTGRTRHAFSLVELLVVIGIIGLLVGITFAVGRTVMGDSRKKATQDTLRTLDLALQAYMDENDGVLPMVVEDPSDSTKLWPLMDGRDLSNSDKGMLNSIGYFMVVAQKSPMSKAMLDKLPAKFVQRIDVDGPSGPQPELPTVLDAWGNPIRFVHPRFDGLISGDGSQPAQSVAAQARDLSKIIGDAKLPQSYACNQVRRNFLDAGGGVPENESDSDGAMCVGNRAYFYSAGEDGEVGWHEHETPGEWVDANLDNVYSNKPSFTEKK